MNDEYRSWDTHAHETIIANIENVDIKSLKQLAWLMKQKNWRYSKKYGSLYPSENQLRNAWNSIKKGGYVEKGYDNYRKKTEITFTYGKRHVLRDAKTGRFIKWLKK